MLDQEIARLPEKYRLPILLCGLQRADQRGSLRAVSWAGRRERSTPVCPGHGNGCAIGWNGAA